MVFAAVDQAIVEKTLAAVEKASVVVVQEDLQI